MGKCREWMKMRVLKSITRTPDWITARDVQEDLSKDSVSFTLQRIGQIVRLLEESHSHIIIRECVNSSQPKYRYRRI